MVQTTQNSDDPRLLLILCQQIETACAQVYREFARLSLSDPEAHDLYDVMASEEEEHAGQFEMLFRIQEISPVRIVPDPRLVHDVHRWVETLVQKAAAAARIPVQETLRLSLKTEEYLLSLHAGLVARIEDPEWQKLFDQLNAGDICHVKKLEAFKKTRNYD